MSIKSIQGATTLNVKAATPKAQGNEAAKPTSQGDSLKVSRPVGAKPQAQGVGEVVTKTVTTGAGVVGGGMFGGMVGWIAWFAANAGGRALSSNVIGIGLLAGAALGAWAGWERGKDAVALFERLSKMS